MECCWFEVGTLDVGSECSGSVCRFATQHADCWTDDPEDADGG
jgi:hypothetical protein